MDTIALDPNTWDLTLDATGKNMAPAATGPYAIAQDVATACRTFLGECWYNTTLGVLYQPFPPAGPAAAAILGKPISPQFTKSQLTTQALRIPDVALVKIFLTGLPTSRILGGQIQIISADGSLAIAQAAAFVNPPWWVNAASREASS